MGFASALLRLSERVGDSLRFLINWLKLGFSTCCFVTVLPRSAAAASACAATSAYSTQIHVWIGTAELYSLTIGFRRLTVSEQGPGNSGKTQR